MTLINAQPPISTDPAITLIGNQLQELVQKLSRQNLVNIITEHETIPVPGSGGVDTANAPLAIAGSTISLNYTSPFYVSSGKLALATQGALLVSGTALTLVTASPLSQSGTSLHLDYVAPFNATTGSLTLLYNAPLYLSSNKLSLGVYGDPLSIDIATVSLRFKYASPLYVNGSSELTVDLSSLITQTDSGEQSMTPTYNFTLGLGAIAPTTPTYQKYRYVTIGNVTTLWIKILWSVAGNAVIALDFALPGGIPVPAIWTSNPNNEMAVFGSGGFGFAANYGPGGLSGAGRSMLYKDSGGTWRIYFSEATPYNATSAWASITYNS